MQTVTLGFDYLPINLLLDFIEEPNQKGCRRLVFENLKLFEQVQGSVHNHQAWPGGFIDHVTDCMNFARHLYEFVAAFGRPLDFSLSDALIVFLFHDIEKPWKYELGADGLLVHRPTFSTRADSQEFRLAKAREYGVELTPAHILGIKYAEGIVEDYSNRDRRTIPLGAFVHMVDHWSARGWYDYPKQDGVDEWEGAGRFRSVI